MHNQESSDITNKATEFGLELSELRDAISKEYEEVANEPTREKISFSYGKKACSFTGI